MTTKDVQSFFDKNISIRDVIKLLGYLATALGLMYGFYDKFQTNLDSRFGAVNTRIDTFNTRIDTVVSMIKNMPKSQCKCQHNECTQPHEVMYGIAGIKGQP